MVHPVKRRTPKVKSRPEIESRPTFRVSDAKDIDFTKIQTYTGKIIDFANFNYRDINIEDIAHSLSQLCRYVGHTSWFYSVAEHSVLVSQACPPEFALWGLLHDATEAYISDIPSPVKHMLYDYRKLEKDVQYLIAKRFSLELPEPEQIYDIDKRICLDEMAYLFNHRVPATGFIVRPNLNISIKCWTPNRANWEFITRYNELVWG